MGDEVFNCVYNVWSGFIWEETCEAGFLQCEEMSCPAYTPRSKPKPITNYDRLISKNQEEPGVICEDGCTPGAPICNSVETIVGETMKEHCQRCRLNWLKAPAEKREGC